MRAVYTECNACGKEVIRAVAKKRKGRCHDCWMEYEQTRTEQKYPYHALRFEADLLEAAYASTPWVLRALGVSLPALLVPQSLRDQYRRFVGQLSPGELVWPFHFNEWSSAYRKGYLVVKNGLPIRAWVTELS
jgi:hypothetical protein